MNAKSDRIRHFTIPVFIPMEACPFQCIFCDQVRISGRKVATAAEEVNFIINRNLKTIPRKNNDIEVGFFGGTFTGLSLERQKDYLDAALPFFTSGKIKGIRLSTRPDYINPEVLDLLGKYPVKTIELGAQSMDDEVLKRSGRGHTSLDTENASRMIREAGFSLGLQMMIGLPGDTEEKSVHTAKRIVDLGAAETRIYPVIVIKGTPLEDLFREGKYQPWELEEAVLVTKKIMTIFERANVKIIRIGLHPSEGLLSKSDYVAGPYHHSFRELVTTILWAERFEALFLKHPPRGRITILVNPADINPAIGYYGKNQKMLEQHFHSVKFVADQQITEKTYYADYY
jgi:histone acetyltransferase (RNA polymerase elongator complex component)